MKLLIIGKMNLRNKLAIICLGIGFCLSAQKNNYPQSIIYKGDTVIVFSREQVIRITEINEENKTCNEVSLMKDTIIQMNKKMLSDCDDIYRKTLYMNDLYKGIIKDKDTLINGYVMNENQLKKDLEEQKKWKNYSLIGNAVLFVLGYITILSK
jgi:hypothetical protein